MYKKLTPSTLFIFLLTPVAHSGECTARQTADLVDSIIANLLDGGARSDAIKNLKNVRNNLTDCGDINGVNLVYWYNAYKELDRWTDESCNAGSENRSPLPLPPPTL